MGENAGGLMPRRRPPACCPTRGAPRRTPFPQKRVPGFTDADAYPVVTTPGGHSAASQQRYRSRAYRAPGRVGSGYMRLVQRSGPPLGAIGCLRARAPWLSRVRFPTGPSPHARVTAAGGHGLRSRGPQDGEGAVILGRRGSTRKKTTRPRNLFLTPARCFGRVQATSQKWAARERRD
jgi:hypothetical protein